MKALEGMYVVGITGTRDGATDAQKAKLQEWLKVITALVHDHEVVVLHGDCVGADQDADVVAQGLKLRRFVMPAAVNDRLRAFCTQRGAEALADPLPPLVRNKAIVEACEVLVALPKGPEELRSGTWSTVRYAIKRGNGVVMIITPNGRVQSGR